MGGGAIKPATPQEAGDVEMLNSIMGGTLDPAHALRVLRKHNNNLEKAASALLEGDTGEGAADPYADLPNLEPLDTATVGPRTPPPSRPEKPVIDLTEAGAAGGRPCRDVDAMAGRWRQTPGVRQPRVEKSPLGNPEIGDFLWYEFLWYEFLC